MSDRWHKSRLGQFLANEGLLLFVGVVFAVIAGALILVSVVGP